MADDKALYSWTSGFDSNDHMRRFLVTLALFFVMLSIFCVVVFGVLGLNVATSTVQVSIGGETKGESRIKRLAVERTGLSIELASGDRFANFLIPANKLWVDSGITVAPGEQVKIIASGSANLSEQLSLNLSNDPAAFDLRTFNQLVGPKGEALNGRATDQREANQLRSPLKIRSDAPLGMLLAAVVLNPLALRENPRPADIVSLEEAEAGFTYKGQQTGKLVLVVNDLLGSRTATDRDVWLLKVTHEGKPTTEAEWRDNVRKAYLKVGAPEADVTSQITKMERRWQAIVDNGYYEAFMEDNSGYFMVSVSISKAK